MRAYFIVLFLFYNGTEAVRKWHQQTRFEANKKAVVKTSPRAVRKSVVATRKGFVAIHSKKHAAAPTASAAPHKEKVGAKRNGIFNNPFDEAKEFGREDYGRRRNEFFRRNNEMMAPFSPFTNPYAANFMGRTMEQTPESGPLGFENNDYSYNNRNADMTKSRIPTDMSEGYMAPPMAPPSDDGFDPQSLAQDYNAYNNKDPLMMGYDRPDAYRRTPPPQQPSYNDRNQFTTLRDIMPKHLPETMTGQQSDNAFIPSQPQQVDNAIDSLMYKLTREQIPERSSMNIPKDTLETSPTENVPPNFLGLPPNPYGNGMPNAMPNGMPDHTVVPTLDSTFGAQGMVQFGPRPMDPRFFQRPQTDMVDGFYNNRNSAPLSNYMMPNLDKQTGLDESSFQSPEVPSSPAAFQTPSPAALQPPDTNDMMPTMLDTLRRMMISPPGEGENENENLYRQPLIARELPTPEPRRPVPPRRRHHRRRTMQNKENNYFQQPTPPQQNPRSMNRILNSIDDDERDFKDSFSLQGTRKNNIVPKNFNFHHRPPPQQQQAQRQQISQQQRERQFFHDYEAAAPLSTNDILNTGDEQQNELENKYRMVLGSVPGDDNAPVRHNNDMTRSRMTHSRRMSSRNGMPHGRMSSANRGMPRNVYGLQRANINVYSSHPSIVPTPMVTTESMFQQPVSRYAQPERFTYDNFMDPMRGFEMIPERSTEGMYGV